MKSDGITKIRKNNAFTFTVAESGEEPETPDEPIVSAIYCNPLSEGGPKIPAKTRIMVGNKVQYCDLDLQYKNVSETGAICVEDYECETNVCIDGKCTSISEKLAEQTSLLKKIWCWVHHPFDGTARDTCENEEA